jgi:hypothetical protein
MFDGVSRHFQQYFSYTVVIGTDCIGVCKSNYHTITATADTHVNKKYIKTFDIKKFSLVYFFLFVIAQNKNNKLA